SSLFVKNRILDKFSRQTEYICVYIQIISVPKVITIVSDDCNHVTNQHHNHIYSDDCHLIVFKNIHVCKEFHHH
ncbi:hypothetical protein DERF_009452, partial [Dermatophagoides farinae]